MKSSRKMLCAKLIALVALLLLLSPSCSNARRSFSHVEYRYDGPLEVGYYSIQTSSNLDSTMKYNDTLIININKERKGFVPDKRLFQNWHSERVVFSDGQVVQSLASHPAPAKGDTRFLWSVTDEKGTIWLFVGTQDEWKKQEKAPPR